MLVYKKNKILLLKYVLNFLYNVIEYYKFMIIINVKFINYVIKVIWVSFKYFLLEYVLILEFII